MGWLNLSLFQAFQNIFTHNNYQEKRTCLGDELLSIISPKCLKKALFN